MAEETETKSSGYGKRPLWQWILIYVVIGVIVYGLIYYFVLAKKGQSPHSSTGGYQAQPTQEQQVAASPSSSEVQQTQNSVTLSATGFSPATLTIKSGTTVTWTNKSGEEATVNSDPHPSHTDYLPLNLGKFADGETLKLTFTKPGTYGYHNHLNPSEKGTIIVQ